MEKIAGKSFSVYTDFIKFTTNENSIFSSVITGMVMRLYKDTWRFSLFFLIIFAFFPLRYFFFYHLFPFFFTVRSMLAII